jgi:hypothetical protein
MFARFPCNRVRGRCLLTMRALQRRHGSALLPWQRKQIANYVAVLVTSATGAARAAVHSIPPLLEAWCNQAQPDVEGRNRVHCSELRRNLMLDKTGEARQVDLKQTR